MSAAGAAAFLLAGCANRPAAPRMPPAAGDNAAIQRDAGAPASRETDSTGAPPAELVEVRRALERGDEERAGFLLGGLLERPAVPLAADHRQEAALLLGDLRYRQGRYGPAFDSYLEALAGPPPRDPAILSRLHFRLASMALHERGDWELARHYLLLARPDLLDDTEQRELAYLRRRLTWRKLGPRELAISDGNISALHADRDDLWVGTWNGGLLRHSLSSGETRVFREDRPSLEPQTVRTIEVAGNRVWVGTYQGLSVYFKVDGSWKTIEEFSRHPAVKVETIRQIGGDLYVGTLGRGLWRQRNGTWERIQRRDLPGNFITCLEEMDGRIYIGTLDLGVVVYNPESGEISSFDRLQSGLGARNVTMLLAEGPQRLWIGTYGDGLYLWADGRSLQHFSRAGGQLGDDWVLCGLATPAGAWFGTFGGGLGFLERSSGRWRAVGLREGLAGLDISAGAGDSPRLFFGTLGSGVIIMDEILVGDAF